MKILTLSILFLLLTASLSLTRSKFQARFKRYELNPSITPNEKETRQPLSVTLLEKSRSKSEFEESEVSETIEKSEAIEASQASDVSEKTDESAEVPPEDTSKETIEPTESANSAGNPPMNPASNTDEGNTQTNSDQTDKSFSKMNDASSETRDTENKESDEIQSAIESALSKSTETVSNVTSELQEAIEGISKSIKHQITESNHELKEEIKELEKKIDETQKSSENVEEIMLEGQLSDKEKELAEIELKISDLKSKITIASSFCNLYTDCTSCAANKKCGWCAFEQKCVEGDSIGPKYEVCSIYSYDVCSGEACAQLTTCDTCINNPACGWCADSTTNQTSCLERGADFKGCSRAGWFHAGGENTVCDALPYLQALRKDSTVSATHQESNTVATPDKMNAETRKNRDDLFKLESRRDQLKQEISSLNKRISYLENETEEIAEGQISKK